VCKAGGANNILNTIFHHLYTRRAGAQGHPTCRGCRSSRRGRISLGETHNPNKSQKLHKSCNNPRSMDLRGHGHPPRILRNGHNPQRGRPSTTCKMPMLRLMGPRGETHLIGKHSEVVNQKSRKNGGQTQIVNHTRGGDVGSQEQPPSVPVNLQSQEVQLIGSRIPVSPATECQSAQRLGITRDN
jgi:hypothetical protein